MIRSNFLRSFVVQVVSFSIFSIGIAQSAGAGMVGTQQLIDGSARNATIARVETFLARQDVAHQLQTFGVNPAFLMSRVDNMTQTELAELEGRLDKNIAGGDSAIAVIGVVFLVLLILELVGVTDVFKAI